MNEGQQGWSIESVGNSVFIWGWRNWQGLDFVEV